MSITNRQGYISKFTLLYLLYKVNSRYLHSPESHQSTRFLELLTDSLTDIITSRASCDIKQESPDDHYRPLSSKMYPLWEMHFEKSLIILRVWKTKQMCKKYASHAWRCWRQYFWEMVTSDRLDKTWVVLCAASTQFPVAHLNAMLLFTWSFLGASLSLFEKRGRDGERRV